MSIETLANVLNFCSVQADYFTVDAGNNQIYCKYDSGSSTLITLTNNTYLGSALATELKTKLDTAFTITSTVTWSSSTRLFTITVAAGHTIQVIVSGSSGALLIGFTSNPTAAVSITSDTVCGVDPTGLVSSIQTGVEAYIQNVYCRRSFESASYSERYDTLSDKLRYYNYIGPNLLNYGYSYGFNYNKDYFGTNGYILNLKQFPITAITRLAVGTEDAMSVKNTSNTTTATVAVNSTGLVLIKDGVSNTSVTFATYTTINDIVTAVNALGSGWSATLASSDYGSYLSSELMAKFGASAIRSNDVYLQVPATAESDYEVYAERGQILFPARDIYGKLAVRIDYTAGYDNSTYNMPEDLKLAVRICTKWFYQKQQEESYGLTNYSVGDVKATFDKLGIPIQAKLILDKYKRVLV